MEDFFIHCQPFPRRFPATFPVASIGYIARKDHWLMRREFGTLNFSLVISGTGEYRTPKGTWPVTGPCVLTQEPGVAYTYGPETMWEELFFIYAPQLQRQFRRRGIWRAGRPMWTLGDATPLRQALIKLSQMRAELHRPGTGDRIDRLCEMTIVESLLHQAPPKRSKVDAAVLALRAEIDADCAAEQDVDETAERSGIAPMTFRRAWQRLVRQPPYHYQLRRRLELAARLLIETDAPIGRVASQVGYRDPLYFSKSFKRMFGRTAGSYREAHRVSY